MFTPRMLAIAIALGGLVGVGVRQAAPDRLSWWFVAACGVSMVFMLAAGMRWNRWHERNVLLAIAGLLVALSISRSIWVFAVGGALYVTYFFAFYIIDTKTFFARYDRTMAKRDHREDERRSDNSKSDR